MKKETVYTKKYAAALQHAVAVMNAYPDLEITSALKQSASDNEIPYGPEMGKFVEWAWKKIMGDRLIGKSPSHKTPKHTPGPWRHRGGSYAGRVTAGDEVVAFVQGVSRGGRGRFSKVGAVANARLVAAAPEMFELIERIARSSEVSDVMKISAKRILAKVEE
jgi:hypothetical protein